MIKLTISLTILCAALLLTAPARAAEDDGVTVLTAKNFDEVINANTHVLVEFYAPWCGHCKKLAPEYAAAAAELKASGNKAVLAKLDADSEKELGKKFEVEGFPTLKWFVNGKPQEYNGGRVTKEIVSWVEKHTGPAYKSINSNQELAAEIEAAKDKPVVVAVLADQSGAVAQEFFTAAQDDASGAVFLIASPGSVTDGLPSTDSIVMKISGRSDETLPVEPAPQAKAINDWIAVYSLPLVVPFSQDTQSAIFGSPVKSQLLAFVEPEKHAAILSRLEAAAGVRRGKITFVSMDVTKDDNKGVLDYFGVTAEEAPTIYLVVLKDQMLKYQYTGAKGDITTSDLESFLEQYEAGSLKVHIKSEPDSPEHLAEAVKVVTGNSFQSLVIDNTKDVLVEFYAPWCGHCKKLEPVYLKMAQELEADGAADLVIAKMDATLNDPPENINVRGYPTLYLFPGNNKQTPILYEGDRTGKAIKKFLRKNAHNTIPDSKKKAETKDSKKSDL